jgi:hypothetical protein
MSQRALTAHIQQPPGTYTVEQGLSRAANSHQTELSHLILAADRITEIFHTGGILYASMGGVPLQLQGSPRNTFDTDVAVGSSMLQFIELFTPSPSVIRISTGLLSWAMAT